MVLRYHYILELITIITDDIDIHGDFLPYIWLHIELEMDPLLYFCVVYFHETYIFKRFIEQKHAWYYVIITD